eukprot:96320-Chlamydomonas_euryale.AAC.10
MDGFLVASERHVHLDRAVGEGSRHVCERHATHMPHLSATRVKRKRRIGSLSYSSTAYSAAMNGTGQQVFPSRTSSVLSHDMTTNSMAASRHAQQLHHDDGRSHAAADVRPVEVVARLNLAPLIRLE